MNRIAVDTNILVYLLLPQEREEDKIKQRAIHQLMEKLKKESFLLLPLQIYKEFLNVAEKKFGLTLQELREIVQVLDSLVPNVVSETVRTVKLTIPLREKYKLSYWDSLIIANCLENKVSILLTEDKTYEFIEINSSKLYMVNPFEEI